MSILWGKLGIEDMAGIVAEHLLKNGIEAVLVGGACAAIYSDGLYASKDLDFVTDTPIRELEPVLAKIGFIKTGLRLFSRPDCEFILDFVPPPVAIGREPVTKTKIIKTPAGHIHALTPTDCVKDRLAAYFHWNDYPSLEHAIIVAKAQKIDLNNIRKWSEGEGEPEKYLEFESKLKKRRSKR